MTSTDSHSCVFKCKANNKCVSRSQICDIINDCPDGEDETWNCDQLPIGAYCPFKKGSIADCSWSTPSENEPEAQWVVKNEYAATNFRKTHKFNDKAVITSPDFDKIPVYHSQATSAYFNSCEIRFSYFIAQQRCSLSVDIFEKDDRHPHGFNRKELFSKLLKDLKRDAGRWIREKITLPHNLNNKFAIDFIATMGHGSSRYSNVNAGVANVSLSKECFAIDVPRNETRIVHNKSSPVPPSSGFFLIPSSKHIKKYEFTSCGKSGYSIPTHRDCKKEYESKGNADVDVIDQKAWKGFQLWTVPHSGLYT
ncbi:leukocyte tyrosine kinase receptor-like protein [Leptotrombidium deliense]|uniref:Leukocyte tyrosine kinase receptor-like protein n=1 Tax=Leptotrombidium deliense TaxID=299467 RepID=A0A443SK93_9ACAR|nr:leukocyte tyrosine kinase receptor-like protein [Leptotrombidium deliense]